MPLKFTAGAGLVLLLAACSASPTTTEPRKEASYIRGPYNAAFFRRHGPSEAYSAGFHFHHGREHDVLLQTKLADRAKVDADFDAQVFDYVKNQKSKVGPTMELFGPYTARTMWRLFRTIDWTHQHHEQPTILWPASAWPGTRKRSGPTAP